MNRLTIYLTLQSPLLISQLGGGDPNSSVGYNYIPGSTLRGALISRYLNGKVDDAAADCDFQRLFLNGSVCYLNGYPLTETGQRALPIPLSWQRAKDAPSNAPVYDRAIVRSVTDQAWKGVGGNGFCCLAGKKAEKIDPMMQINVHIAREDRQRPTAGDATIFRYDALAAGQTFAAIILAEDTADLATIKGLIREGTHLPLGRSRSAGYGWVTVHYPQDDSFQEPTTEWYSEPSEQSTAALPTRLIVTLLSDTLIQDRETGAYCADLQPLLQEQAEERFVRLHTVGGFNRKWNLPLPQAEAIAAGSVFVYEPRNDEQRKDLAQKLMHFAERGIGARRAEGFGRIAVNWQSEPEIALSNQARESQLPSEPQTPTQDSTTGPKVSDSRPLAEQMVKRMVRAELDRLLLQAINTNQIARRQLRNSQLARIRVVARHALEPRQVVTAAQANRINRLADFLLNIKESARNQLQRARIPQLPVDKTVGTDAAEQIPEENWRQGQEPYYDWLTRLAVEPAIVWTILGVPEQLPSVGGITAEKTPELAIEYALRLIDGTAQLATREATDE